MATGTGTGMLLTGFEGYGGRAVNPAEEVVKALDGETVAGVRVAGRLLPVDFGQLEQRIGSLVEETRPRMILCLGLWPGEPMIRLERVAVNVADFEIADNAGNLLRQPVVEGGPVARAATLPLHAIQDCLLAEGIPARLSGSAGTFLCNTTLYHALAAAARLDPPPPCGFLHLPYLPEQVAAILQDARKEARLELHQRADLASMALGTMVETVRLAIRTTLEGVS